jgi:adenosylhomocysteine nucleosidase
VTEEHQSPGFVIAATGLRAEAHVAERLAQVRAVAGGGDGSRLEKLLGEAIAQGGRAIISFGIAAGLAPDKRPGTCLIASEVVHEDKGYPADPLWAGRLQAALGTAELAVVAGVDRPLQSAAAKEALHAETGAAAADMESHIAAWLAAENGLPFAALRVIADPAEQAVPPAALAGMRTDGSVDVLGALAALARAPRQLPAMLRLSGNMRHAMAALFRCHRRLGPGFGFFDLG